MALPLPDAIEKIEPLRTLFLESNYTEIKVVETRNSVAEALVAMLSDGPWWVRLLFQLRRVLVFSLGLERHDENSAQAPLSPQHIPFKPPGKVRLFEVVLGKEDAYWIGKSPKDKHLTAYFGVVAEPLFEDRKRLYVITLVKYLHWTGPIYFNIIRPFHHLIINHMLRVAAEHQNDASEERPCLRRSGR